MRETSVRREQSRLVEAMRAQDRSWIEIAAAIQDRYRVNPRIALRLAHGWTQQQAADAWNRRWPDDPKTLKAFSRWEVWPAPSGHAPPFDVLNRLAELYQCTVADLVADLGDYRHLDTAAEHAGARSHALATSPSPVDRRNAGEAQWHPDTRDEAGPGVDVRAAADSTREHVVTYAAMIVAPSTVEQLHVDVCRLAHDYARTPPLALFRQLVRTRDAAYALMRRTQRPAQLADLYLVAGQVCGLAATTAFDLGMCEEADDFARAAHTYGELVDHGPLKAWARGVQATVAFWSDRPHDGLRYAASGLRYAAGPGAARLHAIAARAWALLGARRQALDALKDAIRAHDTHGATDELGEGIGGEFAFGPARFELCAGAVMLALGDGRGAARHAAEARRLYALAPVSQRRWAVEHGAATDLATALVLQGELEGAIESVGPALGLDTARRTARLTRRLDVLRAAVNRHPYRHAQAARQITAVVDEFTAGSLVASRLSLPAGH